MMIQLDFLEERKKEVDPIELQLQIEKVKESSDKVRKGLFARHNELAKMYLEMKEEFEAWKTTITKVR